MSVPPNARPLQGAKSYPEWIQKALAGELPPPPIGQLLGMRALAADASRAVFELDAGPQHTNPMGTLHGGVICDLADAAMGTALGVTLEEGESFTTLELKANFFKPIWQARLTATARIVKKTRSIAMIECDVTDGGGSLVARLSSTCMILRGEQAQGR